MFLPLQVSYKEADSDDEDEELGAGGGAEPGPGSEEEEEQQGEDASFSGSEGGDEDDEDEGLRASKRARKAAAIGRDDGGFASGVHLGQQHRVGTGADHLDKIRIPYESFRRDFFF